MQKPMQIPGNNRTKSVAKVTSAFSCTDKRKPVFMLTNQIGMICLLFPLLIFAALASTPSVQAQPGSASLQASGYTEALPIFLSFDMPGMGEQNWWEYRLQNRLNLRWHASDNWSFTWEMRTRLFAGDLVDNIPGYARAIDTDNGLVNLSWMVAETDSWFLHYIPDRLYAEWTPDSWSFRAGRQRLNWGINMVTNPNDLFNIYSFYDFAYPERPGADAIRIQHFTGFASRVEVAVSPSRYARRHVAAALWQFNRSGYDLQLIAGYYRHRIAAGGGWAGNIVNTGFKGEFTLFTDIDNQARVPEPFVPDGETRTSTTLVAAISADHMFDNGLFAIAELLYNSDGGRNRFSLLGEPLSADNPSFSRFQATVQGSYAFSPLLSGTLSLAGYPDERAVFISPSVTRSVTENADLTIVSQHFFGADDSIFSDAGFVVAAMFKWNF
jgi:hypothetical protein